MAEPCAVLTMPNRTSLMHTPYWAGMLRTGGDVAAQDDRKLVLDFFLGIVLAMATVLAIALVLIIPYVL
jgi:hypothetical protein